MDELQKNLEEELSSWSKDAWMVTGITIHLTAQDAHRVTIKLNNMSNYCSYEYTHHIYGFVNHKFKLGDILNHHINKYNSNDNSNIRRVHDKKRTFNIRRDI
jgi:hypothetical protein